MPHLTRARLIFPSDPQLLLVSAHLHDRFASPLLQTAAQSIQDTKDIKSDIGTERAELQRAETLYRQALAVAPGNAEARVRLARVLSRLGRHREAVAELKSAASDQLSAEYRYYAELFAGSDEEALGNFNAARAAFQRAVGLFPEAQSPRLALSQLARRQGNKAEARAQLELLSTPGNGGAREDPWWKYYEWR